MARSSYKCAECPNAIKVMGRNRAAADSLAKWHEDQGHICGDCAAKRRDAENASAADANCADELPQLVGSPAQIAWAETIRRAVIDKAQSEADSEPSAEMEAFCLALRARTFAIWWIDIRTLDVDAIAQSLEPQIRAILAPPTAQDTDQHRAEADALLLPPGEAKSRQVAEISFIYPNLRIKFADKRDDFIELMHSLDFTWRRTHWAREINKETAGCYIDRLAETAHHVLSAGFMVRVHDGDARAKAIAGNFEPEQKRWVLRIADGGAHDGWLEFVWARGDDLFAAVKRIPNASWRDKRMVAPPSSVEDVADFAQRYGFSVSRGAMEVLEQRRAELARGIVIAEPKRPARALRSETSRPVLDATALVEVANELLDND
jgi:hypothetical protein